MLISLNTIEINVKCLFTDSAGSCLTYKVSGGEMVRDE